MNPYDLEEMYPSQTLVAIQNFGSEAVTVAELVEELATDDCSIDELEEQIGEEIWRAVRFG